MPTYDYVCEACGHKFEKFQSMTAPSIRKCPKCGKSKVKRLIGTGAGLIFKGSGFYITDYRSESYKKDAKGDSAPAAAPAAESPKAGETKNAETPAAAPKESKPAVTESKPKGKSGKEKS